MPLRLDIEAMDLPTLLYNYVISYGECATDKPFCVRQPSSLKSAIFHSKVDMAYSKPHGNAQFPMVAQIPYDIDI